MPPQAIRQTLRRSYKHIPKRYDDDSPPSRLQASKKPRPSYKHIPKRYNATPTRPRFFDLPPEIRSMIYDVFKHEGNLQFRECTWEYSEHLGRFAFEGYKPSYLGFILSCREAYDALFPDLYKDTFLQIDMKSEREWWTIKRPCFPESIRLDLFVQVNIDLCPRPRLVHDLRFLLQKLSKCKKIKYCEILLDETDIPDEWWGLWDAQQSRILGWWTTVTIPCRVDWGWRGQCTRLPIEGFEEAEEERCKVHGILYE
ncbi:hypothetical protein K461DRAFT_314446 [Myriangium duriaei CBS 260.36]|uniref:Uncharacterized protein n=1 Tax=Myriangium duriaei CBS 260.36 TaxID=1168546 RepID=A0A9P4MER3_9PEZI|nr:hypothetical protein K461DRAFT_314446 [Myriangium duriaei CBS 260.36]